VRTYRHIAMNYEIAHSTIRFDIAINDWKAERIPREDHFHFSREEGRFRRPETELEEVTPSCRA